jgi:hypothetical protein
MQGTLEAIEEPRRALGLLLKPAERLEPRTTSPELTRIVGGISAMAEWLASVSGWTELELRRALRCELEADDESVVGLGEGRLRRCEEFVLGLCRTVQPNLAGGDQCVRDVIALVSDMFVLSGYRMSVALGAIASRTTAASPIELLARGEAAHAYISALSDPALFRPAVSSLSRGLPTAQELEQTNVAPQFIRAIDAAAALLLPDRSHELEPDTRIGASPGLRDALIKASEKLRAGKDLTEGRAADFVDYACRVAAELHHEISSSLPGSESSFIARAAATALLHLHGMHGDLRAPNASTRLLRGAYDALLDREQWLHRDVADLALLYRAAVEIWRLRGLDR